MITVLFALLAGSSIAVDLGPAWAEFSRDPALRLTKSKIEVGTLGYDRSRGQLDFWLRRTITTGVEERESVSWADTKTCVAARPLLASMREIPVPKFAPVGSSKGPPIVLDGVSYSLRTYSDHGKLTAESNIDTPLSLWIENALKALESCWTSKVPERTR